MVKNRKSVLKKLHEIDTAMCLFMNCQSNHRIIRQFFKAASRLGDGIIWYILMAAFLLLDGMEGIKAVSHMLIFGATGTLVYKIMKRSVSRPRPFQVNLSIKNKERALDHFSFPSGHTLHAVIFSLIASIYLPSLFPILISLTVLIGLSRVILGLHYPSDVVVGALIGLLIVKISTFIF